MRIAHVTWRFAPPGGIVANIREIGRRLASGGDEVEVFTSDINVISGERREFVHSTTVDGIPVHRFPLAPEPFARFRFERMTGLVEALSQSGADIIHAHNHRYGYVLQAARAARRAGIPFVVTLSYHPAQVTESLLKRGMVRLADFAFGASAYQLARAVIVQSELEARLVRPFVPASRLRMILDGIDLGEWRAPGADQPSGPPLPPAYFLYVGWLSRRKGVHHLIEALARLPPEVRRPLVLLGRDVGGRAGFEELGRQLGVSELLVWLDPLPRPAYREVVRHATALVLPSEWEAFGQVLVDAMAAGTPAIGTYAGAMPEVLDGGRSGLLVPFGDVDDLARALRAVVEEPVATRGRVQRGLERVTRWDWSEVARQHRELYRSIVGQ